MISSVQAPMIFSRVSQSGQLAATFSFRTELRWRVFCRCCMTNMPARVLVMGSRKKRVRRQKSSTTESRRRRTEGSDILFLNSVFFACTAARLHGSEILRAFSWIAQLHARLHGSAGTVRNDVLDPQKIMRPKWFFLRTQFRSVLKHLSPSPGMRNSLLHV